MARKKNDSLLSIPAATSKHGNQKWYGKNNSNNHYELIVYIIGFMLLNRKESIMCELTWGICLIITLESSCYCITALRDLLAVRLQTGEWDCEYLRSFYLKLCRMAIMWLIYTCTVAS